MVSRLSKNELYELERLAGENIDTLLDGLGVLNLTKGAKAYVGPCPVHGGDNDSALNLFHTGHTKVGNWKCFTHNCHKVFRSSTIGFVRGVLSHNNGWSQRGDQIYSFMDTIEFIHKCLGIEGRTIQVDNQEIEKRRFIYQADNIYFRDSEPVKRLKIEPAQLRTALHFPCSYFICRGFSEAILNKYDVGFCDTPGKPMYMRAVVPVYDNDHKYIIGCSGRSIFDVCPICGTYHNPANKCPEQKYRWLYSKWKNNKGFPGEECLYNYWFAKDHIRKSGIMIIVEGFADVWKLEESGIHIGVSTFGAHLTPQQRNIIDQSGAMAIICVPDPDGAGDQFREILQQELGDLYKLYFPEFVNDLGHINTTKQMVQNKIGSLIEKIKEELYL